MPGNEVRTHHPFRVGLTGGIACGKTVVSKAFARLGVPVIDTDVISREVTEPGRPLLTAIKETFGERMLRPDGSLDRRALREKVFSDKAALEKLNALTHPAIMQELELQCDRSKAPYVLAVIPLLFENSHESYVDSIVVLDAPFELQLKRLLKRDRVTKETALAMIKAQVPREVRRQKADHLIESDRLTIEETAQAVLKLHGLFLKQVTSETQAFHA